MKTRRARNTVYGGLLGLGLLSLAFAYHQHRYAQLIAAGNQAVEEKRFDTQDYDHASRYWFARQDIVLANQGMLAYRAENFPRAADLFRRVSQTARNASIESQALYNLGRILLELKEIEKAADFFKAALRLDPNDREAKFNLERLYHFVLVKEGEHSEASLEQAPGVGEEPNDQGNDGQGRSKPNSDI
jgi:tetratricopeptide (TPR) repeat protein